MDVATFLLGVIALVGGMVGGAVRTWHLSLRVHRLEIASEQALGTLSKVTKTVAAVSRWGRPGADKIEREAQELIAAAKNGNPQATPEPMTWWK